MTQVSLIDPHPDDAIAVIEGEESTTYQELRTLVGQTRAALHAAGLERGDRVGIICSNTRSSVVSVLAAMSGGFVAVPLNPSSPPAELRRELDVVGAAIVLTGTGVAGDLHDRVATPCGATVLGIDPLPDGAPPIPVVDADPDDLAVMLFTSGTAGSPKAAMLSHNNLASNQLALIGMAGDTYDGHQVCLAALPLSHIFGLNLALLITMRTGGTLVLMERFDAAKCVDLIAQHEVTLFSGVPPMWRSFLDLPDVPRDAFGRIERLSSGASALAPRLFNEFREYFGIDISEGYGLTETGPVVTSHVGIACRAGSVGKPLDGVEVKVADFDGILALPDDAGTIMVKSPGVFLGYWNDEEATKLVLDEDGWLNTGDVGVMSGDGYLSLVDRAKDLIIVSGFNVYPYEVESVIKRHPAVAEVVVVGREDERRGERVVAYVTATDPDVPPTLDDVVSFCREELARYKCPSELRVAETLPVTATGKRVRRALDLDE